MEIRGSQKILDAGRRIAIANVQSPHGLDGSIAVKIFSDDPHDIMSYSHLYYGTEGDRCITPVEAGWKGKRFVVRFAEITDRNGAQELSNQILYIPYDDLERLDQDRYYHVDLIGMRLVTKDTTGAQHMLGEVCEVVNYGAGDLLDIALTEGGTRLIPFRKEVTPTVDPEAGEIFIDPDWWVGLE